MTVYPTPQQSRDRVSTHRQHRQTWQAKAEKELQAFFHAAGANSADLDWLIRDLERL